MFRVNKFLTAFPLRNLEWHQVVQSGKKYQQPCLFQVDTFQQNHEAEKHPLHPATAG